MTRHSLSRTAFVAACGLAFAVNAQAQQNTQNAQQRSQSTRPRTTESQNQNQSTEQGSETSRQQNSRTTAREGQAGQPGQREGQAGQAGHLDAQLAACLIIGNEKEIAEARLAEQHAQNEQVKQFAQQMIQDHTKFAEQLAQFAEQGGYQRQQLALDGAEGQEGASRTSQSGQPSQGRQQQQGNDQQRSTTQRSQQPGAADANDATRRSARSEVLDESGRGNDLIAIEREVAQQCIRSAQQELGQKQGAEFDKAYTGMQVHAHQAMLDKLEVFSRHATGELQTALQQGIQTTQQHLQHVKQLHEQVASAAGASGQQGQQNRSSQKSQSNQNQNQNQNK